MTLRNYDRATAEALYAALRDTVPDACRARCPVRATDGDGAYRWKHHPACQKARAALRMAEEEAESADWQTLQDNLTAWADLTFPRSTTSSVLAHIREELLEIEADPEDPLEWADALMMMLHGARRRGFTMDDLYRACEQKFAICKARKWGAPDDAGVVHHIEDVAAEQGTADE